MNIPHFLQELCSTLPVQSHYVLHGNIRDRFLVTPQGLSDPALLPMIASLRTALRQHGYDCVLVYDPIDGLLRADAAHSELDAARARAKGLLPSIKWDEPYTLPQVVELMARLSGPAATGRAALVIDYASRIAAGPQAVRDKEERAFFRGAEKASHTAAPWKDASGRALFNPVIWLVEGERDLPTWMIMGNARIRSIGVPFPDLEARTTAARLEARALGLALDDPQAARVVAEFAEHTAGMTLQAMHEVRTLAEDRGRRYDGLGDAIRIYKFGVENNLWARDHIRKRIREGEVLLPARVKGQQEAVTKTLDILKRAALGLSGAQATSSETRPRGILFFAGATGVGKTELAKAIAETLFGEGSQPLRFDMSEFSAEQSADRLIGAPPGYVGYEAGGELTGAVRRNPFQVILFDEIEKAHKRILDKFLQILEDGRLTDGQGVTTYFSECVLVFTSNLGAQALTAKGRDHDDYAAMEREVLDEVKNHFVREIGRPELLNRLGDNIVVFRLIDRRIAEEISAMQLDNILARVRRAQGITVTVAPEVRAPLSEWCVRDDALVNGGRGVGTALETAFINPLARALFDVDLTGAEQKYVVTKFTHAGNTFSLELT